MSIKRTRLGIHTSSMQAPPEASDWHERAARCGLRLRWNRNRRQLLTLRARSPHEAPVLSIHHQLPAHGLEFDDLLDWFEGGDLPAKVRTIFAQWHDPTADPAALPAMMAAALSPNWSIAAAGQAVARYWFADLPPVHYRWSQQRSGTVRSIRLGSYRSQPTPEIRLHPRLAQPHVPAVFIEYILYHELCHHRQFCEPLPAKSPVRRRLASFGRARQPREMPHSPRFKAWEAAYPLFQQAQLLERTWGPALRDPALYDRICKELPPAGSATNSNAAAASESPLVPLALVDFLEKR